MRVGYSFQLLVAAIFWVLSGCDRRPDAALSVSVIGDDEAAQQLVRAATTEGLVATDAEGRIVPALADRWIVTDDGQSYIFRLRDGTWGDGTPLTGETARIALRQAIAGLRGSALRHEFAVVDDVKAMAGRVIEIRLSRPVPELLQLLAQPDLGLAYRGRGAGALTAKREGTVITVAPIAPEQRGLPTVKGWSERIRSLRIASAPAPLAVRQFASGKVDVVLGGTFNEWPHVLASSLPGQAIRVDPALGLFGLATVHQDGFLAEPENREAISMAIDRAALADALRGPGWMPITRLVPPGLEPVPEQSEERWSALTMAQRQSIAMSRLARWRLRRQSVVLRIALPSGLGADLLFARLATDLAAVGLQVQRVGLRSPADLALVDLVAPYHDLRWYFVQLGCKARPKACSPAADAAYAEAAALAEPAGRAAALAAAEAKLTAENFFIPLGPPLRWSLARPETNGIAPNPWALHPLLPLALNQAE